VNKFSKFSEDSSPLVYEADRKSTFEQLVSTGELPPGIAIDDGAAVHFVDGKATKVISGNAKATAYAVIPTPEGITTKMIQDIEFVSLV